MAPENVPLLLRRDSQGRVGKVDPCHEGFSCAKDTPYLKRPKHCSELSSVSPIRLAGKWYQYVNLRSMLRLQSSISHIKVRALDKTNMTVILMYD